MKAYIRSSITKWVALIWLSGLWAQNASVQDSVVPREPYGLRIGYDLAKTWRSQTKEGYTGNEFSADLRIGGFRYLAVEVGREKITLMEDRYVWTPSGSYLKAGLDVNFYDNWFGMNNMIFGGFRLARAHYEVKTESMMWYDSNRYWHPDQYAIATEIPGPVRGLKSHWVEAVVGIKAELFKNVYLGGSLRLGYLVSAPKSINAPNHWIPGFNTVTDEARFGSSYQYQLSYLVPLFERPKVYRKKKPQLESGGEDPFSGSRNRGQSGFRDGGF